MEVVCAEDEDNPLDLLAEHSLPSIVQAAHSLYSQPGVDPVSLVHIFTRKKCSNNEAHKTR